MKNIVIIGGSSGIGLALTQELSAGGHKVFATYNSTKAENSENVSYHHLDVLGEEYDFSYLPESIDGLVYCPGSINLKPFARVKANAFLDDYKLQVLGAVRVTQELLQRLKRGNDPSIVYFSTIAVNQGFNFHTLVATSKGAIEGLTKSLAAEVAPRIRVNCIAPSLTNTPLAGRMLNSEDKMEANAKRHPLQRVGEPGDIAAIASFLLSERASWITGQILRVDGGLSTLQV